MTGAPLALKLRSLRKIAKSHILYVRIILFWSLALAAALMFFNSPYLHSLRGVYGRYALVCLIHTISGSEKDIKERASLFVSACIGSFVRIARFYPWKCLMIKIGAVRILAVSLDVQSYQAFFAFSVGPS